MRNHGLCHVLRILRFFRFTPTHPASLRMTGGVDTHFRQIVRASERRLRRLALASKAEGIDASSGVNVNSRLGCASPRRIRPPSRTLSIGSSKSFAFI